MFEASGAGTFPLFCGGGLGGDGWGPGAGGAAEKLAKQNAAAPMRTAPPAICVQVKLPCALLATCGKEAPLFILRATVSMRFDKS